MFKRYVYSEGLTNLHGSNGEYLINVLGQVKDKIGNDLPITRDSEGHQVVHCHGWDGVRDYRVIDLVAIQYKSIHIPESKFGKVEAFVADDDPDNTHAVNVGYRFKGGPLEVDDHPGFYYVPGYTRVAINKAGVVLEVKTKCFKKYWITPPDKKRNSKGGYYQLTGIYFCPKVYSGCTRHRMLCLVFKEYPNNVDSMTVNHIDGIPGNDWLDNLEWTTYGENNRHAFENDLKTNNTRVLVRDVLTDEVKEYYCFSECARVLGLSVETIRSRTTESKFSQVFEDGKQFKLKNDKRDWIIPKDPQKSIDEAQIRTPVLVRNCATGEVNRYNSQMEAARKTSIDRILLKNRFKTDNRKPLYGYQFKLETDIRPWLDFTYEDYILSLNGYRYKVEARNLLTNEKIEFVSILKAENYFGFIKLTKKLTSGKQVLLPTGWQIKLNHHEWEEIPDVEEAVYKLNKDITARNEFTGKIYIGNNSLHLGNVLGLNSTEIRKAALTRGNKVYGGFRFRLGVSSEPWPETVTAN